MGCDKRQHDLDAGDGCRGCISITQGMSGYFAIHLTCINGTCDVEQTGIGRYSDEELAISEAEDWAKSENLLLNVD